MEGSRAPECEQRRGLFHALVWPLQQFAGVEGASGIVLALAVAVAMAWANWSPSYAGAWAATPRFVINDVLMTAFFYVAGLELRREWVGSRSRAMLPVLAALGGMIAPAIVYLAIARGGVSRGWAIPVATDLAFALGALSLVGRGLPPSLRVFLLALAIVDDLGASIVIAVFYSHGIAIGGVALALGAIAVLAALKHRSGAWLAVSLAASVVVWIGLSRAHVHPALAGMILAMLVPGEPARADRVEQALHPWVAFAVVPLFALANIGVDLHAPLANWTVLAGVAAGLAVGKTLGVFGATALTVRLGLSPLPEAASWRGMLVIAEIAGIGFTMALFIAQLAFGDSPELEASARVGLLIGSAAAVAIAVPFSVLARRAGAAAYRARGREPRP